MATLVAVMEAEIFFGDGLAEGEVEGGVVWQILVGVGRGWIGRAVVEAGAEVDVGGGVGVRGERGVEAEVERVALVVIDRCVGESGVAGGIADGSADESAGDVAALLGDLVGVGEVGLAEVSDAWGGWRMRLRG